MNYVTIFIHVVGLVLWMFIVVCSLTYRCAYFKQKLLNRTTDPVVIKQIRDADKFWSFLR